MYACIIFYLFFILLIYILCQTLQFNWHIIDTALGLLSHYNFLSKHCLFMYIFCILAFLCFVQVRIGCYNSVKYCLHLHPFVIPDSDQDHP